MAADLRGVIEARFPAGSEPTPGDQGRQLHDAFARSRGGVYIERRDYFDRLDAHASAVGPPLVVVGESGAGKSSLLANWALARRDRTATAGNDRPPIVMHFVAASPDSADWAAMLRRLLGEFNVLFGLEIEIPEPAVAEIFSETETLAKAFNDALGRVAEHHRVVLVIDGLDQLNDRDGAPDLVWLRPTSRPTFVCCSRRCPAGLRQSWPAVTANGSEWFPLTSRSEPS